MKCKICNKLYLPPGHGVCQICTVTEGTTELRDNFIRDPDAFIGACHICLNKDTDNCITCILRKK